MTCPLPQPAQVNVPYSGSCAATGGTSPYTYAVTAGTLPGGLSLNTASGAITGAPTAAGTAFSFTITATDSSTPSLSGFAQVSNFVVNPALGLSCNLASAVTNIPYSGTCTATGGTPNYTYSISAGTLPLGLGINSTSGVISGTPTAAGSAYSFIVQVKDSNATPQTATFPVTNFLVAPALTLTCNFPAAELGVVYANAGCTAQGGTPAYLYSISAGSLPTGLSISSSTGAVTGTPTTAGTYSFTVQVQDNSSTPQIATQPQSNFPVAAALTLTCTAPSNAIVNASYTYAGCSAQGGVQPLTYSVSVGSLPPGLSINSSTGAVTGTPTTAGNYSLSVQVQDSDSTRQVATQPISISVASALTLTCTLPLNAEVGAPYAGPGCSAQGGSSPYAFSISNGSLPQGLNLNQSSGAVTGTPTTAGSYSFTVKVTDNSPTQQSATYVATSFPVAVAPTLTCTGSNQAVTGAPYSGNCNAAGGSGTFSYSVSAGSFP